MLGGAVWQGLEQAFPELPDLTPPKIERALRFLLKQGLIEMAQSPADKNVYQPQMTEAGGRRLDKLFPVYQEKREWNGQVYLINYDFPLKNNAQRDALRLFLKSIGCGMLQSSVWLTPYNPTKKLSKFVEQKGLKGSVIVSTLLEEWGLPEAGKFGGRDFPAVLSEIYGLGEMDQRYQDFTRKVESRDVEGKMRLAFAYFSILKDDPQLPFELLPKDWSGAKAWKAFEGLFFEK